MNAADERDRDRRALRFADEHAAEPEPGTGRYAVVVGLDGRNRLLRVDDLTDLRPEGTLLALINLDYAHPAQGR